MKVLSLTEPYATLIKNNIKTIETRSWSTKYRGKLYIHASSTKISKEVKANTKLMNLLNNEKTSEGYIICSCNLTDVIKMTKEYIEEIKTKEPNNYITGLYEEGRYAWILEDIKPLETLILAKGKLSIWEYEEK